MNNIPESNKKIALFMGAEIDNSQYHTETITMSLKKDGKSSFTGGCYGTVYLGEKGYTPYQLKYHSSWDWLMPVVEKIKLSFKTGDEECIKWNTVINGSLHLVRIDYLWNEIVNYIQWYNEKEN